MPGLPIFLREVFGDFVSGFIEARGEAIGLAAYTAFRKYDRWVFSVRGVFAFGDTRVLNFGIKSIAATFLLIARGLSDFSVRSFVLPTDSIYNIIRYQVLSYVAPN
jgi:hypothetical protein